MYSTIGVLINVQSHDGLDKGGPARSATAEATLSSASSSVARTMSLVGGPESRISELKQQINNLSEEAKSLETARASCTCLMHLPDEILVHIAHFAAAELAFKVSPVEFLKMTWICHQLRKVLISASQLWVYIDLGWSPHAIQLFMDYAASARLHVSMNASKTSGEKFASMTASTPRATTLSLYDVNSEFREAANEAPGPIDAPLLRSLDIALSTGPETIFRTILCPNLVYLSIRHLLIGDALPNVPTLRFLKLEYTYYPLEPLHSFLNRTPLLEDIHLQTAIHMTSFLDEDEIAAFRPARLSYLRKLVIQDPLGDQPALPLRILPKPSCALRIKLIPDGIDDSDNTQLESQQYLMRRISEFWRNLPDTSGILPEGQVHFDWKGETHQLSIVFASQSLEYEISGRSVITCRDDTLSCIRTAIFRFLYEWQDEYPTPIRRAEGLDLERLSNLERITIRDARVLMPEHEEDARVLEAWIMSRIQTGRPLQEIAFVACGACMRQLCDRLGEANAACAVTWEDPTVVDEIGDLVEYE
jgi:hypothetical protein